MFESIETTKLHESTRHMRNKESIIISSEVRKVEKMTQNEKENDNEDQLEK